MNRYYAETGGHIMLFFQNAGAGMFTFLLIITVIFGIVLFVIYYIKKAVRIYLETINQPSRNNPVKYDKKQPTTYDKTEIIPSMIMEKKVELLICPHCEHTYKDLSLSFCLEDGELLRKTIVSMPPDPEETIISNKFK